MIFLYVVQITVEILCPYSRMDVTPSIDFTPINCRLGAFYTKSWDSRNEDGSKKIFVSTVILLFNFELFIGGRSNYHEYQPISSAHMRRSDLALTSAPAPKGRKQTYDTFKTAKEEEWPIPLMRNGEVIEKPAKQSLFTQRYTNEAISFIKKNKENPFFVYLAHNMPHVPLFASEKFKGKSKGGIFGDVIEELDWSVGEIVKTLKEQGLSDSTLVVFTSDNGPWTMFKEFGGTAAPLRGEKSTTWEGGPRVPCIFYWPGRIKPSVSSEFMVNIDMYRTIASVTGSKVRPGEAADSLDMSEVLFHNQKSPRKNYLFIHKIPLSYRSGDYKIHFGTRERSRNPDTGQGEPPVMLDKPLLFNVKKDIGEKNDIASENPEILQRLSKEFHAAVKDITGQDYGK